MFDIHINMNGGVIIAHTRTRLRSPPLSANFWLLVALNNRTSVGLLPFFYFILNMGRIKYSASTRYTTLAYSNSALLVIVEFIISTN